MKSPIHPQFSLPYKFINISLFSILTLIPNITLALPTAQLKNWQFNPKNQQLEINVSSTITPKYFYLSQPPRLVLDLPDTQIGKVSTQQNYQGVIEKIRISQLNQTTTRIVLDLAPGTSIEPKQIQLKPITSKKNTGWVFNPRISSGKISSSANHLFLKPNQTLPPSTNISNNNQQPLITVPPLNSVKISPQPNSQIPSAMFPQNNDQPVPLAPIPIIEFGEPLPK
jgi:hypothetical protein